MISRIRFLATLTVVALCTRVVSGETLRIVALEIVTDRAATGDGGNAWGGHQCRIVRTRDGVFTAFTAPGAESTQREWRLAHRRADGWRVIASGNSGREPVNLLAAPDGTLHVIGWPGGKSTIWSGKPASAGIAMSSHRIDGLHQGHWPYGSAGIDRNGNLYVLSSGGSKPGVLNWAAYEAKSDRWTRYSTPTDYRHCYTYVIPDNGALSFVSTRDVRWQVLGHRQPAGASDYAYTAFGLWRTARVGAIPVKQLASLSEEPTSEHPHGECNAQIDAYLDTTGKLHVLYRRRGQTTQGQEQRRHAIFLADGTLIRDVRIPDSAGAFCRVFQDVQERFYLLGSAGVVYAAGDDGLTLSEPIKLDLRNHLVEYSGFGLAVPRTGAARGDQVDLVFPSGNGSQWFYGRLQLSDEKGQSADFFCGALTTASLRKSMASASRPRCSTLIQSSGPISTAR